MTTETFLAPDHTSSPWANALMFGVLSFALTLFCVELIKVSGQISPLWFSTALMTILVFRQPNKLLPLQLACCVLGIAVANALVLGYSFTAIRFPLLNLAQALLGGLLLRALLDRKTPLDSLLSWSKMFVAVGLFTPLVGGLLACWMLSASGHASFRFVSIWVISESIGMLALGPVCLLWQRDYLRKAINQNQLFETLLTLLSTVVVCYCVLRYLPWPFTFVMVVLFYSAIRLPRLEAFIVFLATLSMMMLMLALHLLDMSSENGGVVTNMPWLPFLLAIIPSHMMALVMHSFREEKKHISESENRFRTAMEYSAIGMALVSPQGKWLQVNKSLCTLLGYQECELKAMDFQQITHPEDLDVDLAQVNALLRGDIETYSLEKRYFRKDGQIVWALLAVSLVRDSEYLPLYFISQIEDFTDLKKTEEVNRLLMQRVTLANEAGGVGVWDWNLKTGKMSWDKRMFQIYGLPENGLATYLTWANSLHPADRQMAIDAFDDAVKTSSPIDLVFRIETATDTRYIHSQAMMMLDDKGDVERMLGINQDVTNMRRLTDALYQEKERMHITLDAIGEAVISTDEEMRVTFMNPVAESMSGWKQESAAGKPIGDILRITHGSLGPEMENRLLCELTQSKSASKLEQELVLHSSSGDQFDIHYSITPLKTLEGDNIGSVIVIQDVSESREMMRRLSYSASHDMLTRLPNRVSFEQRLKQMLQTASEQNRQHALIFIDLDRFKAVNDSAGHAAGDALLREISGMMQHHLRSSDFLARLGGDEFGVLLQDCPPDNAREVTDRIVKAVNDYRFLWEGRLHRVGASAGITMLDDSNCSASEVMAQADLACYNAKHSGRGQLSVFESHLLSDLKPALSRAENERIIAQQPMRLRVWAVAPPRKIQSVSFYLAEMQLFTPEGEEIDEVSFRAGLHDDDLMAALDRKRVVEFFQQYAAGVIGKELTVILPLSAAGLHDESFIAETTALSGRANLPGKWLYFSLPSEALLNADEQTRRNVEHLRDSGCGIVLNNFGRNLDAFNQLPVELIDYLILSHDLIANVHCNLMDEMMVSILQGHAQRLNIATLAGPAELPVALTTLSTIGVDCVWGGAIADRQPLSALLNNSDFAIK
ncbi:diguanylate cyclase [Pantoea sp. BAV 3049]|uniref:diguanylate cyclase n=1 Tax=Pantoea sp. BAV 3049 TaxID=2654188 RepID=UPI00131B8A75|nr:diguanylate cyclase [Pantoea sp. BAV 3049]